MTTTQLEITPGETGDWLITVRNADGTPKNLGTLQAATFVVKDSKSASATARLTVTLASGAISVVDAAAGELRVVAAMGLTAQLTPARRYRWYLYLSFNDGTASYPDGLSGEFLALAV